MSKEPSFTVIIFGQVGETFFLLNNFELDIAGIGVLAPLIRHVKLGPLDLLASDMDSDMESEADRSAA